MFLRPFAIAVTSYLLGAKGTMSAMAGAAAVFVLSAGCRELLWQGVWELLRGHVVFRASRTTSWNDELTNQEAMMPSHQCNNCQYLQSHFLHDAVYHVGNVRSNGNDGRYDRCCSTTTSFGGAIGRAARDKTMVVHIILLLNKDKDTVADMAEVVNHDWFASFCKNCELSSWVAGDVKAWAEHLDEIVVNRQRGDAYKVCTLAPSQVSLLSALPKRGLDLLGVAFGRWLASMRPHVIAEELPAST